MKKTPKNPECKPFINQMLEPTTMGPWVFSFGSESESKNVHVDVSGFKLNFKLMDKVLHMFT